MKNKLLIAILGLILLLPGVAQANSNIVVNQISFSDFFYGSTFDNKALDFSVTLEAGDTLQNLVLKNEGSASDSTEIEKVNLYLDNGNNVFDGYGLEILLSTATYNADNNVWLFKNINKALSIGTHRFFVGVDTKKSGTNNRSIQLSIPKYQDYNGNYSFDSGDFGIYFKTLRGLPSSDMININGAMYRAFVADVFKPYAAFTNLIDDGEMTDSGFLIKGVAKDQGGSQVNSLSVCIDATCYAATDKGTSYSAWEYQWNNISVAAHTLYLKATDGNDNTLLSSPIVISRVEPSPVIDESLFSAEYSQVILNKIQADADGVDKVEVKVYLRNALNAPIVNKLLFLNEQRTAGDVVFKSKRTDENGFASFTISNTAPSIVVFTISTDDGLAVTNGFAIQFLAVKKAVDYTVGAWVKTSSSSAVYFLDSGNVRHAYPTQKVWESYFGKDFSFVKTITDEEMAEIELGRNVPFKDGTLMKIPSVNKVYKVETGVLRWIKTEAKAIELFGSAWAKLVRDLPESFFTDYSAGESIE